MCHCGLACRSKCNAATAIGEKLEYENLDLFLQVLRDTQKIMGTQLSLWKACLVLVHACKNHVAILVVQADIDSAFRRIPIRPDHRMYANVVFKCNDQTLVAQHLSVMFGSVASVHHWERVGKCTVSAM